MAKRKIVLSNKQKHPEIIPSGYKAFITALKSKIRSSQLKAAIAVNRELIRLYWEIGKDVIERQEQDGWGSKVIERVARDLQNEFPGIEGFSKSNIFRMRAFYKSYTIVAQAVRQLEKLPIFSIPWSHNIAIFQSIKDVKARLWYANMTIEEGWSRDELIGSIKRHWFKRYGKAITNFEDRLPDPHSRLAQEATKDPYYFDVRRDIRINILSRAERILGRRYLS